MSIAEFVVPPSWSLDGSAIGRAEKTVGKGGGGHGGRKQNRETDIDCVLLCRCEFSFKVFK